MTADRDRIQPCGSEDSGEEPLTTSRGLLLVTILVLSVVGLLCAASMFPENVAMNWSSLLLSEQGAAAGHMGLGLVALQGTMIVGRLVGAGSSMPLARVLLSRGAGGSGDPRHERLAPALLRSRDDDRDGDLRSRLCRRRARDLLCCRRRRRSSPGLGLTVVSRLARLTGLLAPPAVGWLADDHGTVSGPGLWTTGRPHHGHLLADPASSSRVLIAGPYCTDHDGSGSGDDDDSNVDNGVEEERW